MKFRIKNTYAHFTAHNNNKKKSIFWTIQSLCKNDIIFNFFYYTFYIEFVELFYSQKSINSTQDNV